jgi:hypothetical protein
MVLHKVTIGRKRVMKRVPNISLDKQRNWQPWGVNSRTSEQKEPRLMCSTFPLNMVTDTGATELFALLGIYVIYISRFSYL